MLAQNKSELLSNDKTISKNSLCLMMEAGSLKYILPRVLVAEVFRYEEDIISTNKTEKLKLLQWRGFQVPIVSSKLINKNANIEISNDSKIIIFHGLLNPEKLPYYALLSSSNPDLIEVSDSTFSKSEDLSPLQKGELSKVLTESGEAVIPKVEYLEKFILDNYSE